MNNGMLARFFFLSLLAPLACGPGPYDPHPGDARLLDSACQNGACATSGGAQRVSGPTADSTGFLLNGAPFGAPESSVRIPLTSAVIPAADNICEVQVLVSGSGKFEVGGAYAEWFDAPQEYAWIRVSGDCKTPLQISVPTGSTLSLDDVRLVTTQTAPGCGGNY